jgi:hypothetical protein
MEVQVIMQAHGGAVMSVILKPYSEYQHQTIPLIVSSQKKNNKKPQDILDAEFKVINELNGEEKKKRTKKQDKSKIFEEIEKNTILFKNSGENGKYLEEQINNSSEEENETSEGNGKTSYQNNTGNSFQETFIKELKEKILNNYNRSSLENIINKHKDIVSSLRKSCKNIVGFLDKVTEHLSTLSEDQKSRNMTLLKGLIFDNMA